MRQRLLLAGALVGLSFASAASAQALQRPQAPQVAPMPMPQPPPPQMRFPEPYRDAPNNPLRAAELDRQLWAERTKREALLNASPERLDRANRVGALIDRGLCGPAAQLAWTEHDAAMARNVPLACANHRAGRPG